MSDLRGNFGFMPCRDLFRYLGNRRLSGTLTARRNGVEKSVVVHEGAAVSAASTDPREYLGQILINSGHLTEEEFEKAYRTQLETKVPIGQILAMIGLVPEEVVRRALAVKIRETALDLCDWRTGEFTFSAHAPTLQGGVPQAVSLLELAQESEARSRAWVAFRRLIPSGDTRLERMPGVDPRAWNAGSAEQRILELLATPRTVDDLSRDLHAAEYSLYQRLYSLIQEGAIRVAAGSPASAAAEDPDTWFPDATPAPQREPPLSVAQLLDRARDALAAGSLAEAADLAARAADKGDPRGTELLKQAEERLLAQLRKELLANPRVPFLTVDRQQIKAMPLNPPERYLLSRMDGVRQLGSVVRVAPMRELDALRLVKRLHRDGVIRFA